MYVQVGRVACCKALCFLTFYISDLSYIGLFSVVIHLPAGGPTH